MEESLKYMLIAVAAVFILYFGYKMIKVIHEQGCNTEIAKFEIDLKGVGGDLRFGAKELRSYAVPCKADKIYIFDLSKEANPEDFNDIPIMKDSIQSRSGNLFLLKDGDVRRGFNIGNIGLPSPYVCLKPNFYKISLFVEGAGKYAKITIPEYQPQC